MAVPATLARFARKIAADVQGGRTPSLTDELIAYIEEHPRDVMHSLDGLLDQLRRDGETAEAMAGAYLMLLSIQLERLRYRIDEEYGDARELVDAFLEHLVRLARAGDLPEVGLMAVKGALYDAKIPPSAALTKIGDEMLDVADVEIDPDESIEAILSTIAAQHGDDGFAIRDRMNEFFYATPVGLREMVVDIMVGGPSEAIRDAGALSLLDPEEKIRRTAAMSLLRVAPDITATTLRRLITIRNWWPEGDRHLIDEVVQAARALGVECAPWEPARDSEFHASAIDGSGAQGILVVTPAGRRQRLSSVTVRHGTGIIDAWSAEPEIRKRISETMARANEATLLLPVSDDYVDREIGRQLYCGQRNGTVPPVGLIQVAETIAAAQWRPQRLDFAEVLDRLCAELPDGLDRPETIDEIIWSSADWGSIHSLSDSWYEEDKEVRDLLDGSDDDSDELLLHRVLEDIVEPRSSKWAERFVWTALWLKEAPADQALPWPQFTVLARELADGRHAAGIPLMESIAFTTIVAYDG